jgi:Fic family protein
VHSFDPNYLANLQIPHHLVSAIRQIGEYKGKQDLYKQQAPQMLENLLHVAIIQSTESSNRLEGITAEYQRIKDLVEEKTSPENRPEAEIAGYRDVLNTIHSNHRNIPFTVNMVLQLHRDLMKYAGKEGGRWKSVQNQITETNPDGTQKIRFTPVEPFQTPESMEALHQRFDNARKQQVVDPLILIALYSFDFLCIHPFLDGNGRMARLLTVLLLYYHDFEVARYISLERIVEQTKDSYYDTLYRSSQGWHQGQHDIMPWMEYIISTILAAYKEFESRLGRLSKGRGSKADIVQNAIDGFIGDFSLTDLEEACPDVSRDWIRAVLQRLRKENKVEAIGKGRYSRWRKVN